MKFSHFLIFVPSERLSLTKPIGSRGETRDRASTAVLQTSLPLSVLQASFFGTSLLRTW